MTGLSTPHLPALNPPQTWQWRGHSICYHAQGQHGPALLLIHGFGASWGHWRKVIPLLAEQFRVYTIDLLGFGASDKPSPDKVAYTFETWSAQVRDFCQEVVRSPIYLVGNSIGCVVALQAAVDNPNSGDIRGVVLINCSLRLLHERRRQALPWYRRQGADVMQRVLTVRWLGHQFFRLIAKPNTVKRILLQAYARPEAVTDELVDLLMKPAADAGAADVFLAFTGYSQGPLPEDLLAVLPCPALVLWGEDDPWEPIALGERFTEFSAVENFVRLDRAGHCPQDEVPDVVSQEISRWVLEKEKAIAFS